MLFNKYYIPLLLITFTAQAMKKTTLHKRTKSKKTVTFNLSANTTIPANTTSYEINEKLMDVEDDPNLKLHLQSAIDNLQSEIYEPVKKIIEHYQDGVTTEEELLQVKEYYYKKKYLHRIRQQLSGMS